MKRAVAVTMSPMGRNVIIKREYGTTVSHDGVTVADAIVVENAELAAGAEIIKEAAGKLNNEVGDGTTSVTVLTYTLMEQVNQIIGDDLNVMNVRRDLINVQKYLTGKLAELTIELDDEKLLDVAAISAGDKELGALIGKLALEVGKNGVITVERGRGYQTEPEVSKGFTFERSYLSPYFITDKKKQEAVLNNSVIFITNEKLKTYAQVESLLQHGDPKAESILIICDELSGEALSSIVQTNSRGMAQIAAVQAPHFGDARREILEDIAVVTGGEVFSENQSGTIGRAAKVVIGRELTTIIGGAGEEDEVKTHTSALKERLAEQESDYEKEKLEARIANVIGKVGTIKVGGASESEADEKKYRVDDAVAAVKAAQLGGVVAGGGVTLFNLAEDLAKAPLSINEQVRAAVVAALKEPLATILRNGNIDYNEVVEKISGTTGKGVDVTDYKDIIDMVEAGIIDPSRVTEKVINTAFSIAMTAITSDVLVVDVPDEV